MKQINRHYRFITNVLPNALGTGIAMLARGCIRRLLLSLLAFVVVGCTSHSQFRTALGHRSLEPYPQSAKLIDNQKSYRDEIGKLAIEDYPEFLLGFVEFDDQGRFWDRMQTDKLIAHIRKDDIVKRNGAIIMVFTHGWFHNSEVRDENVRQFRGLLFDLARYEGQMPHPRKVIGVFAGWRGLSATVNPFKALSFWDRKETAHRVGGGDLIELLVRLDGLKQDVSRQKVSPGEKSSRMVVLGHSFGGSAVYSAVGSILKQRAVASIRADKEVSQGQPPDLITGFGDLVVLINPAFEALLYSGIAEAMKAAPCYHPEQTTLLLTVGADNDKATGVAFPVGRFIPTSMQRFKNSDERKLSRTTLGNYRPYFTDQLNISDSTVVPSPPVEKTPPQAPTRTQPWHPPSTIDSHRPLHEQRPVHGRQPVWSDFLPQNRHWQIEQIHADRPVNRPFMVVTASSRIVDGHSGIWSVQFCEFLRDFIIAQDLLKQTYQQ